MQIRIGGEFRDVPRNSMQVQEQILQKSRAGIIRWIDRD